MSSDSGALDDLLREDRRFPPPRDFADRAAMNDPSVYERAASDPEAYWSTWASELDWFEPWHTVLEWTPPHAKWFLGGKLNVSHNSAYVNVRASPGSPSHRSAGRSPRPACT